MDRCNKVWLFVKLYFSALSTATHILQFSFTAVKGINLPEYIAVGVLDGEQFMYYDSNIRKAIPKTEWIKNITADEPHFWDREAERQQGREERFNIRVATAVQSFNKTEEVQIWQWMFGCDLDDDGSIRGYTQYGYDGDDFISLDLKALSWITSTTEAAITGMKWEVTGHRAKECKEFLKFECGNMLKKYLSYGREALVRTVCPEVSLFQRHSSSPEVVCHATGFYPESVMITWQKDGEDMHEDVDVRDTLPNQDGSFQKRSILKVPAEDLQKHTYTCVIQHSSLGEELVLPVSERRILRGGESGGALITGVVMAFGAVLVVVAGILWKKSGFKLVPQNSTSSSEDSSSNNS